MAKYKKTNAMRYIEQHGIEYDVKTYQTRDGKIDGVSVAEKINEPVSRVFKTLVLKGKSRKLYVCMIPSDEQLSLKKVAKVTGEKSVDLLPVKKLRSKTGYVKGGCSPLAMKQAYPTIIDQSITEEDYLYFSAGKVGIQIKLDSNDLIDLLESQVENITQ